MHPRHFLMSLWLVVVFAFTGVPTLAQVDEAVYTTYDGLLSLSLPARWVVDPNGDVSGSGFFSVASSEPALAVMQQNNQATNPSSIPDGEVGIIIFRWTYLMQTFSVGKPGDTPCDTLQAMFGDQIAQLNIDTEDTTVGSYPAAMFKTADEKSAGAVYALDLGAGGVAVFAISAASEADYAQQESAILSFLGGLDFGGDAMVYYSPTGFMPTGRFWSPDGQTYVLVRSYPLGEQAVSAALYRATGEPLAEVAGLGASWNNGGNQAALYGDYAGSAVPVIDTATGETLFTLGTGASAVRWSPDDQYIVAGDLRQALRIWDAATGRQLYSLDPAQLWAFNADLTRLAAWNYGGTDVRVIDMSSGAVVWTAPRAATYFDAIYNIPEVSWSPDGTHLLVVTQEGVPSLLDGTSGAVTASFPPTADMEFTRGTWDANGLLLAYRSTDCRVQSCKGEAVVVDTSSGSELLRMSQDNPFESPIWSPDGSLLATATAFGALTVSAWDAQSGKLVWTTPLPDALSSRITLHWIGDASILVESNAAVSPLLDAATGEVISQNPHVNKVEAVVLNSDQSQMLVFGGPVVRIRTPGDGQQVMAMPHDGDVKKASWSDDESLIFTTTEGGTFSVWDATSGRRLVRIDDRSSAADTNRDLFTYVSPDGQWVGTSLSGSAYTRVWPLGDRLDAARAAIAAETQTAADFLEAGQAASQAEDYDAMVEANLQAIRIDPDGVSAYDGLGIAYYRQGKLTQAVDTLKTAILIDPSFLSSYQYLGDIYRRENSHAAARSAYEDGLAAAVSDKDRAYFYNRLGLTYTPGEATWPDAIEAFTSAIELDPTQPAYFRNRGYVNYWQGEASYPQAIEDFETYVELAGDKADQETVDLLAELRGS